MTIDPLIDTGSVVYTHAVVALAAVLIGLLQLLLPKGTPRHIYVGWAWVVLMVMVACTSFAIHEIRMFGPFSAIHLLSLLVLYSLAEGILRVRRGDVDGHRRTMLALYFFGMLLTGALTLLPGRVMHAVVFGG
jgi:uncharacterized membrane protein